MRVRYDLVAVYVYRLVDGEPRFLVLRRAAGRPFAGTWSVVYGSSHAGETAVRAARREMAEETGLTPLRLHGINSVDTFFIASTNEIYHCPGFAAEVAADAVAKLNDEHDAMEWLDPSAAKARMIWAAQRHTIDEIVQEIIGDGPARPFLEIRS